MQFDIVTIFPKIFDSYFNESLLKRAQAKRLIHIAVHDLRDFTTDRHHKVDDRPFGGGPGMVLKVEPVYRATQKIKSRNAGGKSRVILFSTRGKKFDAKAAQRLAKYDQLILICGRYEGMDERVAEHVADEEISIGDFVLSGGELPAMVLVEAVARFIPGVLGKRESLEQVKGSYPTYTRPEVFAIKSKISAEGGSASGGKNQKSKIWKAPKVLLAGNHRKIEEWRRKRGRE